MHEKKFVNLVSADDEMVLVSSFSIELKCSIWLCSLLYWNRRCRSSIQIDIAKHFSAIYVTKVNKKSIILCQQLFIWLKKSRLIISRLLLLINRFWVLIPLLHSYFFSFLVEMPFSKQFVSFDFYMSFFNFFCYFGDSYFYTRVKRWKRLLNKIADLDL